MTNEQEKKPIDKVRDGALSMQVGNDDEGPIFGMIGVADTDMYIIKQHAIYRVLLADEIDPERTNINIPNGQQRIASEGSESDIVARSFLTADALFNSNQIDKTVDVKQVIDLSISVMNALLAAKSVEDSLISELHSALIGFQQPKQRSVSIPSIEGLSERLETYVQRIEHAAQGVYRFSQQFYGHTEKMWNGFEAEVTRRYGEADEFSQFVASIRPFMVFVRNLRNSIEHPKAYQCVKIKDFAITTDGMLESPTIELIHSSSPQSEMGIEGFLPQVSGQLLDIFELLIVFIASKHMRKFGGLEKAVGFLNPDEMRPGSKVRVSYFVRLGDVGGS